MLVEISLDGCDSSTVVVMDVTESEYIFLEKLSELTEKTSTYTCMPVLYVEKKDK